jgi:hypothetical protein
LHAPVFCVRLLSAMRLFSGTCSWFRFYMRVLSDSWL